MTPPPPSPSSRAEAVYRALRRAIIEQAIAAGAKLPEDAIGEQMGVSRTVVREALARLAAEGLVESRHHRGASVASPSLEEARGIFAVRRAMEALVMEELAGRIGGADLTRLEAHIAEEERAEASGSVESIRLAGEFHLLLAEMTGNALLIRYVNELASRCSLILSLYGRPHSADCAVSEHRALLATLREGRREDGKRLMDEHLQAVMGRALIAPPRSRDLKAILADYAGPAQPSRQRRDKDRT